MVVDNVTGEVLTPIDDADYPGGAGDDELHGQAANDTILMSKGTDTVFGGSGTDNYDASSGSRAVGETIQVSISGTGVNSGAGTVVKTVHGTTDTLTSFEQISAGEDSAEADEIVITGLVDYMQVSGLADTSVGVFTPSSGSSGPISFGGPGEPTLSDIMSFGYDPGTGVVSPVGTFRITSGDESGTVGDITFQNFETIEFSTICFAPGTLIKSSKGPRKVETLEAGDMVCTLDGEDQTIRWVHVDENAIEGGDSYPILIKADALGFGRPSSLGASTHGEV